MIPLRDTVPAYRFPFVTILFIVVNVAVFFHEVKLGVHINEFIKIYGIVPQHYFELTAQNRFNLFERFYPFLTSMFLHGGWMHLIGNMWFLWIFGDNVEDRLGHVRYLILYLIFGIVSGFAHTYINPHSSMPTVGASGAIAGVMGAYFIYFPRARILTLIPIFIFLQFIEIPAYFFLGIWFLFQFLSGAAQFSMRSGSLGGIAWFAHIGGFLCGILTALIFYRNRSSAKYAQYSKN
ncbi:rhomboid family intramembrane serine protease [candidate division KSB1 bacterium]|nr:rhomboid family intramembrane serine protease [candidate division KSB1 bacterium]